VLRDAPDALVRVPVDRPERFADAVVQLANQPDARIAMQKAARALYQKSFDWPVLARGMCEGLGLSRTRNASEPAPAAANRS
jgi:hypothetical protein